MPGSPSPRTLRTIRRRLLAWYDADHRAFPWRATRDPYAVLVSEVMLQQTQATRVVERFPRFLARFPTARELASAAPATVLAEWNGLGYNRRALALRATAAAVDGGGGWPAEVRALERLPGVGPYTARAIASLAFDQPVGVVDTNVRRWLVRRLRVEDRPPELQRSADALAGSEPDGRAADWTHASMEFGARICRARAPRCDVCPVAQGCPSRGRAAAVPVPRQAPLHGSERAYRGAVVRDLTASSDHRLPIAAIRAQLERGAKRIGPALDDGGWERVLHGLERDRLVHRVDGELRLGAGTIGP
jgi:A/G-specific adenine glycosylase